MEGKNRTRGESGSSSIRLPASDGLQSSAVNDRGRKVPDRKTNVTPNNGSKCFMVQDSKNKKLLQVPDFGFFEMISLS